MKKYRKVLGIVLVMGLCMSALAACTKTTDNNSAIESETEKKNDAFDSDVYEEFLEGNKTLSFKYYMDNVYVDDGLKGYLEDVMLMLASDDKKYTISELKNALNENTDEGVGLMEYAYIDCGADGVKELVIRMEWPFIVPEARGFFVIKEIDSQLQVVYADYEDGERQHKTINKYGYISSEYRDATSVLSNSGEYINKDGEYEYGYSLNNNRNFEGWADLMEQKGYQLRSLEERLYWYTLELEPRSINDSEDDFCPYYSYEVYDEETEEKIDIPDLYTDSPYKTVMDYFTIECGWEFTSVEDIYQKIDDKLESIGVTEQILNGEEAEFTELNIN